MFKKSSLAIDTILNIARQRSAPGSKSVFWEPGRLENHDFYDFSDFHQNAQPGWSPTRSYNFAQRNRNETGVGSIDRSFDASSGKNAPVQNELGDFSKFSKNYFQCHKNLSLFESANLAPPHPRITLSEQGSTCHLKHCAAAQRP